MMTLSFHAANGLDLLEIDRLTIDVNDTRVSFGSSVAMYQDYVAVGAPQLNNGAERSGAAYIYQRNNQTNEYVKVFDLAPNNATYHENFGGGIAMNENYVIVGCPFEDGRVVYIFEKDCNGINSNGISNCSWTLIKILPDVNPYSASTSRFGWKISLSSNYCVIPARQYSTSSGNETFSSAGSVFIYNMNNNFTQIGRIESDNPYTYQLFGTSVAIMESDDGDECFLAIGDYNNDAVYIYQCNDTDWIQIDSISGPSDTDFGYSVSMNSNFDIVVGAPYQYQDSLGAVYVYEYDSTNNVWNEKTSLTRSNSDDEEFGLNVVAGEYFSLIADGEYFPTVYVYDSNWTRVDKVNPELNWFGTSMSIYDDYCIIGASGISPDIGDAVIYQTIASGESTTGEPYNTTIGAGGSGGDSQDKGTKNVSLRIVSGVLHVFVLLAFTW